MDNIHDDASQIVRDNQEHHIRKRTSALQNEVLVLLFQSYQEQQKLLLLYQMIFEEFLPMLQQELPQQQIAFIQDRADKAQQSWAHLRELGRQSEEKQADLRAIQAIKDGKAL